MTDESAYPWRWLTRCRSGVKCDMSGVDTVFKDRVEAGQKLAERLEAYRSENPVVLGLARGGIIVAAEVAAALNAPLDVMIARKIGAPSQPELGIGAVAPGGVTVLDDRLIRMLDLTKDDIERLSARENAELERRLAAYRDGDGGDIQGRTVILVDDGLATGVTALAAVRSLRKHNPRKIVAAFPVCSLQGTRLLEGEADDVVCISMPADLYAVGAWYRDFSQTTDQEVVDVLREAAHELDQGSVREREVHIRIGDTLLTGDLRIPDSAESLVIFAHGSGSSRLSPRNRFVADHLNRYSHATLLVDLLTPREEQEDRYSGHLRFDIGLLAERMHLVTQWAQEDPDVASMVVGYFGASTGAAAALIASTKNPNVVKAIVSRGGRPDLAGAALAHVTAPTLLIVGSHDYPVIAMNEDAFSRLGSRDKKVEIIEGATHLFEEPGTLEQVADLATEWFTRHLLRRN